MHKKTKYLHNILKTKFQFGLCEKKKKKKITSIILFSVSTFLFSPERYNLLIFQFLDDRNLKIDNFK